MTYVYLALAIVFEVVGTTALKAAADWRLLPTLIVIVAYCAAFSFLGLTLKTMSLGTAYAIWAGVGVGLVAMVGVFFYGEVVDLPGLFGLALIVAGVVVLNVWSKMAAH